MRALTAAEPADGGVRLTLPYTYPSSGLVRLLLREQNGSVIVSDERGAIHEAQSSGIDVGNADRVLRHITTPLGLIIQGGAIMSPAVSLPYVSGRMMLVAGASRDAANWLYTHAKVRPERDFRALLADLLQKRFADTITSGEKITGASNKSYTFPFSLNLPSGKRLLVDTVINESSSINARVVANLDVRSNGNEMLEQRIVYDDYDLWDPANINILSAGAQVIAFSRLDAVFSRMANLG